MADSSLMGPLALLFLVVFALNVPPAFAPPTWMAISILGLKYPGMSTALVAVVGAAGATSGRMVLAHLAGRIVASRFVGRAMRDNLASVAEVIQQQRSRSIGIFFVFAFSPLPSNVLFLSYGLTRAPLPLLAIPFFIGRCASYAALFAGVAMVSGHFGVQMADWGPWLWAWFVLGQIVLLALVYAFAKVDWRRTVKERHLRWTS